MVKAEELRRRKVEGELGVRVGNVVSRGSVPQYARDAGEGTVEIPIGQKVRPQGQKWQLHIGRRGNAWQGKNVIVRVP